MTRINHTNHTLAVTEKWLSASTNERKAEISNFLSTHESYKSFDVQDAFDNGHVVLRIEESIPANKRGLFLLELEQKIKQAVDIGITIWLEPVGDKSKLRQLRGVEVKS
jgi:phage-related protein